MPQPRQAVLVEELECTGISVAITCVGLPSIQCMTLLLLSTNHGIYSLCESVSTFHVNWIPLTWTYIYTRQLVYVGESLEFEVVRFREDLGSTLVGMVPTHEIVRSITHRPLNYCECREFRT
jgi:hypothetical protein